MIQIIKAGKDLPKYRKECNECGCVFLHQEEDVYDDRDLLELTVKCPNCGKGLVHNYYDMEPFID